MVLLVLCGIHTTSFASQGSNQIGFSAAQKYNLSLHPPPGDVSIVFLGNIFGSVDGALAGSGSQMVGEMFGVFNAAVLAFGGIVLLYSLVVSTGNTAHEGQFIGQKWSSIWIPLRSFVGVGVIIPVSSGYCLMQVFVMTIVVQGVGAADSVWNAALDYLNRGGVIVQRQMKPSTSAGADDGRVLNAAMGISAAQICMKALEIKFTSLHERQVQLASTDGSKCSPNVTNSSAWTYFCNNPVPDFLESVNIASDDNMSSDASDYCVYSGNMCHQLMPDFSKEEDNSIYHTLTGVCGLLTWSPYKQATDDGTLNARDKFSMNNSRTIAIYQMYLGLLPLTKAMINNSPAFNPDIDCTETPCLDSNSKYNFGQPLTLDYSTACSGRNEDNITFSSPEACVTWGASRQASALFNGTELLDTVAAYNGIMLPTLSSASLTTNHQDDYKEARKFISQAKSQGWLMAGAYFFQLALLNNYVEAQAGGNQTDTGSNLSFKADARATWEYKNIEVKLTNLGEPFSTLSLAAFEDIGNLLGGTKNYKKSVLPTFESFKSGTSPAWYEPEYNSLFAYLVNANSMVFETQTTVLDAGLKDMGPADFNPSTAIPALGDMSISGGKWGVAGKGISLLFNTIVQPLFKMIMDLMLPFAIALLSVVISPIVGMVGTIFNNALEVMRVEGVNPIIAISNMGTSFIDGVGNAWMGLLIYASIYGMLPAGQGLLQALMPVVTVWMGIMLGVGFTAAFYAPFVPFLIFSFAGIGWLISVIESMVAAPIVALGVIMPEGHDTFGKSEPAFMLLLNVFLRPSMMVLGFIFGIILSYVGVWVMNAGFNYAMHDIKLLPTITESNFGKGLANSSTNAHYGFWSNIFLLYFAVLTYVSTYEAIVLQAFDMIHYLPDKVLRWIAGGIEEQFGEGTVQSMKQEVKAQSDKASKAAAGAMAKVSATLSKPEKEEKDDDDDDDDDEEEEGEEGDSEGDIGGAS